MLVQEDVELVEVHMCQFGMVAFDKSGEVFVRKRAKVLFDSEVNIVKHKTCNIF